MDSKKELQTCQPECHKPKEAKKKPLEFPPKEFCCRNSILTDLWEETSAGTIYNFGSSLVILVNLHAVLLYFVDYDKLALYLSIIAWTFGKFHMVAFIWFSMMGSILLILYPTFRFWVVSRFPTCKVGIHDLLFLTIFIAFQFALIILPCKIILQHDIPFGSSFFIVIEQMRLIMKCHAFVRENAEKVLKYKPHQGGDEKNGTKPCPNLNNLLYFLFAPTLLYRDSYPRTPYIRWRLVVNYFLQILGCSLVCCIIQALLVCETFKDFGKGLQPLENLVGASITVMFTTAIYMFLSFYIFFHCWLNAFAEILRFGDRMFYQDWWNSKSHANLFKKWNYVVHDWFYYYIYRDAYFLLGGSRACAIAVVFVLTGLLHEYVMMVCMKIAIPLMFCFLAVSGGLLTYFVRNRTTNMWNVYVLTSWLLSWQMLVYFYAAEWFARKNCPIVSDTWLDYILPRCLTCY